MIEDQPTDDVSELWAQFTDPQQAAKRYSANLNDVGELFFCYRELALLLADTTDGRETITRNLSNLDPLQQASVLFAMADHPNEQLLQIAQVGALAPESQLRMEALNFLCSWHLEEFIKRTRNGLEDKSEFVRTAAATWALRATARLVRDLGKTYEAISADHSEHVRSTLMDEKDNFDPEELRVGLKWLSDEIEEV